MCFSLSKHTATLAESGSSSHAKLFCFLPQSLSERHKEAYCSEIKAITMLRSPASSASIGSLRSRSDHQILEERGESADIFFLLWGHCNALLGIYLFNSPITRPSSWILAADEWQDPAWFIVCQRILAPCFCFCLMDRQWALKKKQLTLADLLSIIWVNTLCWPTLFSLQKASRGGEHLIWACLHSKPVPICIMHTKP